jgi:8-oxo-dGTP diphosphatase
MTNKRESCTMIFVNSRREVLMILRDDKPGIKYPNTWDLPGGHLEGDETPQNCIRREMSEELPGLSLGAFQLYKDADFPDRIDHIFWTTLDATEEDLNRILREGQRTAWMSRSKLREVSIAFGFDSLLQEFWDKVDTGALRLEPPKNIVICCDGTWNRFDRDKNTNVSKLCYCLEHHHPNQVMYYDPGVGTLASEQWRTWLGRAWSKIKAARSGPASRATSPKPIPFSPSNTYPATGFFFSGSAAAHTQSGPWPRS